MAQQIFDQYAPLAKVSANETIPVVAAIAQTRDGKDELLHGTVPFVPAGGLYVPVSAANRLPVEATLSGSTELKKASIGAHVSHRWARTVRGVNVDFTTTGSQPLAPLEQVVALDIAGPGRLIMARFVTRNLTSSTDIIIEVDGHAVSGQAAQWLTGFFSLMDESRLNLSAGRTHGPWEILTRESNKYALGLDGSKLGPWSTSLKITLGNRSTSDPITIGSIIWYAVMSSQAMSLHGTGTRVASGEIREMLAQQWPNTDEYSVVTRDKEEGDGWECEVFWRNGVDEQAIRALLAQEFGLV